MEKTHNQSTHMKESREYAKHLDENYIEKGKKLKQSEWEKLFEYFNAIKEHEYLEDGFDTSNLYPRVFSFNGFEKLLTKRAKKIYNHKVMNTVYEYNDYGNRFLDWIANRVLKVQMYNMYLAPKLLIKGAIKKPFNYNLCRWFTSMFKPTRKANLVRYFGKTIELGTEEEFSSYIKRFAAAFNQMVDMGIIVQGTLMPLMIMPLAKEKGEPDRVMLLVYSVAGIDWDNEKINAIMGNKIAQNEGACPDMDWTNL